MIVWFVPVLPVVAGPIVWWRARNWSRGVLATVGMTVMVATMALAVVAAVGGAHAHYRWGAGLDVSMATGGAASVAAILVPAVAVVVVGYAAFHEHVASLGRAIGILVFFVGAMEVVVLADDLLTLLTAWELVGACSWALIGHEWHRSDTMRAANQAFVVTHVGDLGLLAAAGAAFAGTGSLRYAALGELHGWPAQVVVAGIVVAATAKSAQLPFSPWLFSAMAGPTSVSALLHSATMVAAGAFILIRLHPMLDTVGWFSPAAIAIGLMTTVAGGVVAVRQQHAKKILAASTSAHYGLMFVAVGAGYPAVALAHLVAHAAVKATLFLSAGVAIEAAGTPDVAEMRLGRELPLVAAVTGTVCLALAGVPPLGAAWTKEQVVAAAGTKSAWLAVATAVAGALSAAYALRFQLLVYGREPHSRHSGRRLGRRPTAVEQGALVIGGVVCVGAGALWLPGAERVVRRVNAGVLPGGHEWQTVMSLTLIALAGSAMWRTLTVQRDRGRSVSIGPIANWFGLETLARVVVTDPVLRFSAWAARHAEPLFDAPSQASATAAQRTAARAARFDGDVVDGAVRSVAAAARWSANAAAHGIEAVFDGATGAVAWLVGTIGRAARRTQTGRVYQYYVLVVGAVVALAFAVAIWS